MVEFRGNTVLTFDKRGQGAIVLERLNDLENSIRRWLGTTGTTSTSSSPSKNRPGDRSVQAMVLRTYCPHATRPWRPFGPVNRAKEITILRTEYPARDLSIVDVAEQGLLQGPRPRAAGPQHRASTGAGHGHR